MSFFSFLSSHLFQPVLWSVPNSLLFYILWSIPKRERKRQQEREGNQRQERVRKIHEKKERKRHTQREKRIETHTKREKERHTHKKKETHKEIVTILFYEWQRQTSKTFSQFTLTYREIEKEMETNWYTTTKSNRKEHFTRLWQKEKVRKTKSSNSFLRKRNTQI